VVFLALVFHGHKHRSALVVAVGLVRSLETGDDDQGLCQILQQSIIYAGLEFGQECCMSGDSVGQKDEDRSCVFAVTVVILLTSSCRHLKMGS
jgi:hypothetical protein